MSKVIFKMTFKHPNLKDTKSKNVSHVQYIATRAGVDKTLTESDLKKELEKGVEDLSLNSTSDEDYVKYIDERPNSHGLFGQNGVEDPVEIQEELSEVNSFVWRGIVSLREEDAKKLGYLDKSQWQDMLRKKVPDMAAEMKIPLSNLRWVGAVHMEKGHPHAHINVWEKQPQKTVGIVSSKSLENIRKTFTDEIFEEERFQLMNEKNIMRDLLKDLAKNDISKAAQLIKEVRASGEELKSFINDAKEEGITPKLYTEEEQKITQMVKILADKLPGKGRINLKFMPEDIKEEVRQVADYLLSQPEFAASLEKQLKAVEKMTKMYTGKEDAIQKARDNTYKDIRDRISQVILKGAVESQRDNFLYIDKELSEKAVDFIKNIKNEIDLVPEHTKVINQLASTLVKINYNDEEIVKQIKTFAKEESISYSEESIKNIIEEIREMKGAFNEEENFLSSSKKINAYLSTMKATEHTEKEAFEKVEELIDKNNNILEKKLEDLKDEGIFKKAGNNYKLTNKGIEEILKVKELDKAEKEILKALEKNAEDEEYPKLDFKMILENKNIFSSLYNKDPDELKLGKFDTKVREVFGEKNTITFKELEEKIYNKYTDDELNTNEEKAEKEFDILKNRIEKLTLNGYIEFNKETEVYSFTTETNEYFNYDEEKDVYAFTEEAIEKLNIPKQMEFTRYDATVTLSYIDKAKGSCLTKEELNNFLKKEITNQTAKNYYEKFTNLITLKEPEIKKYIAIDKEGNISSTEEGKKLGIELSSINKYINKAKGNLTDEKLKKLCKKEFGNNGEKQYLKISTNIKKQMEKGNILEDKKTGIYKVNPIINDVSKLLYQIYKEEGTINQNNLKEVLEKNIPNYQAESQFKYLVWRLDNLKKQGYLTGHEEYELTQAGIEKREDLLVPERDILRKNLSYLERLKLIEKTGENYQVTDKYYKYMKEVALAKENKTDRTSDIIPKNILYLIDRTQDNVDAGKIKRINERIARGKDINKEYEDIETDYESVRTSLNITDIASKTINKIATTLLISGVELEEVKEIINHWNVQSGSNIEIEKVENAIEKAEETVQENNLWNKATVINTKDWKEMFEALGVEEKNIPTWIYKGENWKNIGLATTINDIWKSAWSELEKQRMETENQAKSMKRQLDKQVANQNKEAVKEAIRKNKERGSFNREDEQEI